MDNISNFLNACTELGLPTFSQFRPADLYENTNMTQVLLTLQEVKRVSEK